MRFSARVFCCLILVFIASFFIATKSFAQSVPPASSSATQYNSPNIDSNVPINQHTWTQSVLIETMSAVICQLSGIDPINQNQPCLGVDSSSGKIGFVQSGGGAIGIMTSAITMLYTPPITNSEYFYAMTKDFGLVKKADAAQNPCDNPKQFGTGFCGLTPLLGLWTAMRNIVYLLFTLIFVVIGFAIMIRAKIDPRTVMTIQNQIPKIIVGILLVTFSFAIAGFFIDVMYTSIYLLGNTIIQTDPQIANTTIVAQVAQSSSTFGGLSTAISTNANKALPTYEDLPAEAAGSVKDLVSPLFDSTPGKLITAGFGSIFGKIVTDSSAGFLSKIFPNNNILQVLIGGATLVVPGGAVARVAINAAIGSLPYLIGAGLAASPLGSQFEGILAWLIAFLVVNIAIMYALFRLWFSLIKAYLFFIINVVFSPFWILIGLMPGAQLSFGNWLREIISDLAVFPAAIVMFLLGRVFMDQFAAPGPAFSPPMVGNLATPKAFSALIGMGVVLLTPAMLDKIKDAIKAPKVDLSPVYNALGVGTGAPGGITHGISSFGFTLSGLKSVPGLSNLPGIKNVAQGGHPPSGHS